MVNSMSPHSYLYRFLVIFTLLFAPCVGSSYVDGFKLKGWADADTRTDIGNVQPGDFQKSGRLAGYVLGVHDVLKGIHMICGTSRVRVGQLVVIVEKYVRENPDKWDNSGSSLVLVALTSSFPCKQ